MTADRGPSGGGAGDPLVRQLSLVAGLLAIPVCWPLLQAWIPPHSRFAFLDLVLEHWSHRNALRPWLDQRWAWLAAHHYHLWFAIVALPGVFAISTVQAIAGRSPKPLLLGPLGWLAGMGVGFALYMSFRVDSWALAVPMPALFSFTGGGVAARLAVQPGRTRHLRGTRIGEFRWRMLHRWRARLIGQVMLAGVPLSREDEAMHIAVIGATGSGKSTALRALMADVVGRGDRQVVADPDGASMNTFLADDDIILNPFDPRCARWDLLSEIERPGDHAFIAGSLIPHLGQSDHDQWISYAQQLLAGALENFVTLKLGTSADFIRMLASARIDELKELCAGTSAARYFEAGAEKMLASILGTLAPAIGHLRLIGTVEGPPFSIRRWIRDGAGTLWMPYSANQIAALRGLISCWMNIAILETLSLQPAAERRIWFHIDELDALGRIEGLKDAQARLRKYGGCVTIGFQSFAQVKQIYGEGAHTIIENCGNLLLLRAGGSADGGTARLATDLIGDREVERDDLSRSLSRGRHLTRSQSMQTRRTIEDTALASEIMQLETGEGYLKRATDPDWVRVRVARP